MADKRIITCAVTGSAPTSAHNHPDFPITPKQIADAAIEAAKAGAAIVHLHVRDPETGNSVRHPELFRETVSRIRERGTDVVINLTCGGGGYFKPDPEDESRGLPESDVGAPENRIEHLKDTLPEIASLDICTGNQVEASDEFVYLNTTRTLRGMAKWMKDLGVKPEMEIFEIGDLLFGEQLVKEGLIEGNPLYQMVLGVKWGSPADAESIMYMRNKLPANARWVAFGLGRMQFPMVAQSVLMGGNVRVGLEDNLYLRKGEYATNAQLVEKAVRIIDDLGYGDVATPAQARDILGLTKHG